MASVIRRRTSDCNVPLRETCLKNEMASGFRFRTFRVLVGMYQPVSLRIWLGSHFHGLCVKRGQQERKEVLDTARRMCGGG